MVSKIRKVLFYRLSMNDKQGKIISPKELEAKFDKIIQEYMIKIPNSIDMQFLLRRKMKYLLSN